MSLSIFVGMLLGVQGASPEPTTAQLKQDVAFLEAKLPEVHLNFSKVVGEAEWRERCTATQSDLERLSGTARLLRMAKLVNSLGVAHTWLEVGKGPFQLLPIRFRWFDDGLIVYATNPGHSDLAGARVLEVGGKGEKDIVDRIGGLESNENVYWRRMKVSNWCGAGDAYFATGLSDSASRVQFKFQLANGRIETRWIEGSASVTDLKAVYDPSKLPSFMRKVDPPYQIVRHTDSKSLILDYRRCQADPNQPVDALAKSYWQTFDDEGFRNVVVDLRRNQGGNSAVLAPFIQSVRDRPELLKGKRVYALISNETFSSGMMNAVELRRAGAILMGQPTGGSPNSFGEMKFFELPNSKLRVSYCVKYFRLVSDPKQTTVVPDVAVPWKWSDISKGEDACLNRIRG